MLMLSGWQCAALSLCQMRRLSPRNPLKLCSWKATSPDDSRGPHLNWNLVPFGWECVIGQNRVCAHWVGRLKVGPLIGGLGVNPLLKSWIQLIQLNKELPNSICPSISQCLHTCQLRKNWTHKIVWNGKETAKESRHRPVGIQPRMSRTRSGDCRVCFPVWN